jgi:murein DD-endopeptidase MepM/ murein hydrolase activator NlpD
MQKSNVIRGAGLVLAVFALLAAGTANAQEPAGRWLMSGDAASDEISPQQRLRIQYEIAAAKETPAVRRALAGRKAAGAVALQWPLRATHDDGSGYHGISNYVDHDPAFPGRIRDYTCGTRSYDTSGGYNHAGTDYFLWPFPWRSMDEEAVAVVAAAPGVIVGRNDGHPDRSCTMGDRPWNAVYLRHDDGSVTWYGHLKRGSVTSKTIGDTVETGEYLGLVGSSGSSTGPHLHFELHDAAGGVIDPRHGACNAEPEHWSPPQTYFDTAINTLTIHAAEPEFVECGLIDGAEAHEQTHAVDSVVPGSTFQAFASYRDHRAGESATFTLTRPDGTEFARWNHDLADSNPQRTFYPATAWYWAHTLPADAAHGYWHFNAAFNDRTYTRAFYVGSAEEARDSAVRQERAAVGTMRPPRTASAARD